MTSSLVGSEMCIRDRGPCSPAPVNCLPILVLVIGGPSNGSNFRCHPSRAVSYTHLTLPTICSV
eukprot:4133022-Prorocentrum_lima.AAC.1